MKELQLTEIKNYVVRFQLYDEQDRNGGNLAFRNNQDGKHSLLRLPQYIQTNLKDIRDEDKLDETLVGRYVEIEKFYRWMKNLKYKLNLKKNNPNKITRKEFDKLIQGKNGKKRQALIKYH